MLLGGLNAAWDACTHAASRSLLPAVQRTANQLVEEFMLLANMSVARVVATAFPLRALLRRHPEPNLRKIDNLTRFADALVSLLVSMSVSWSGACQAPVCPGWGLVGFADEQPAKGAIQRAHVCQPNPASCICTEQIVHLLIAPPPDMLVSLLCCTG